MESGRKNNIAWRNWSRSLRILEVATIIGTLVFVSIQVRDVRNFESAKLLFTIDNELTSRSNPDLINAIERDEPIFIGNGGKFNEDEVDDLLGVYELLASVGNARLIDDDMLYSAFSYYLEQAYNNHEIRRYLSEIRKEDPTFFLGFESLAKSFLKE